MPCLTVLVCAQAGAQKVYAVEASNMAEYCRVLASSNGGTALAKP